MPHKVKRCLASATSTQWQSQYPSASYSRLHVWNCYTDWETSRYGLFSTNPFKRMTAYGFMLQHRQNWDSVRLLDNPAARNSSFYYVLLILEWIYQYNHRFPVAVVIGNHLPILLTFRSECPLFTVQTTKQCLVV
jgi:hypothetical protein